ncbi:MAG: hypothetical protein Q8M92_04770 [Candidatus Subteraquimicrobiales bacterium]|nr:hypothetical protein [Candidatus Subteraquimicrobiales bacterium]
MEFEILYEKLKKLEKKTNIEEMDVYEESIGIVWDEFVDVQINDRMFLTSTILLTDAGLEIYGATGAKLFELSEIEEIDIDV